MKFLNKLKNILLTLFGIFFIVEMIRRLKSGESSEIDITDIKERIKQSEEALKQIEQSNPKIDDIINDWNNSK